MEENTVIFDISSDEEPGFDVAEADDYSWLKRLLCDDGDDSDEVVVVGEVKSKSSKPTVNSEDEDDCVVLDGDPDKPVAVDDDQEAEGDDLVVVGQKGPIACRDYPHPRHLCAKFPFSSTTHKTHCDLCHCYVCDIPVPCAHWGTGVSSVDHCHATEKEEFWKSQRKNFRLQKDAPLPVKVPDTSFSTPLPQLNLTPPCDIVQLPSNPIPHNPVSRPAILRTCSPSTRLTVRKSGPVLSRNRFPTRTVSQQSQMLRVHNNVLRNPGMFKRAGIAGGALEMNQYVYGSSNNTIGAYGAQCTRDPAPRATSNDRIHIQWVPGMNHDSFTYPSTPQTGMGNPFVGTVPPQSQMYGQSLSQPEVYGETMSQQSGYGQPIPQPQPYSHPLPQPSVCNQHIPQINNGQNVNQLGNLKQNSTALDFSEFDEWMSISSQSNQQPQVENCQLPIAGSINEPLPIEEFSSECNRNLEVQYNYTGYDNCFPDSQYVQVSDGYIPSELDVVNPDPASFDAGMLLFDFETSFNGLAHA